MPSHTAWRPRWPGLLVATLVLLAGCTHSREASVQPEDPNLARAETLLAQDRDLDAALAVRSIPRSEDEQIIRWGEARAERLSGLILLELAKRQLPRDPEAALKWMFVGQLRVNYDANRCKNKWWIGGAGNFLFDWTKETNQYSEQNPDKAAAAAKVAMAWEASHPPSTSPAWICDLRSRLKSEKGDNIVDPAFWPQRLDEARRGFRESLQVHYGLLPDVYKAPPILANPENPLGYRIIDGDPAVAPLWTEAKLYWIDDQRVLFVRTEPGHFTANEELQTAAKEKRRTSTLSLWTVGGGVQALAQLVGWFCYNPNDQHISFVTLRSGDVVKGMEGPPEQLAPFERTVPPGRQGGFDSRTCHWVERQAGERPRFGIELLPGHGFLIFPRSATGPAQLERPGETAAIPMPFGSSSLRFGGYYPFKGAYFIWENGFGQTGLIDFEERFQRTGCKEAWWLWPDGRTEEVCIPYIPGARTPSVQAVPTARGLFVAFDKSDALTKAGRAGAYLMTPQGLVKIFSGVIGYHSLAVSPNGCKVAMAFASSDLAWRYVGPGPRTLRAVDLCSTDK